jgi:ankyrin repeat protein
MQLFTDFGELRDITTTPFMVEIVVGILRELHGQQPTPAQFKQKLALQIRADKRYEQEFGKGLTARDAEDIDIDTLVEMVWTDWKDASICTIEGLNNAQAYLQQAETGSQDANVQTWIEAVSNRKTLIEQNQNVLKRKPLVRYMIYDTFVQHFIRREAEKSLQLASSEFSVHEIMSDAIIYANKLAVKMTAENMVKVQFSDSDSIFKTESDWDVFFNQDETTSRIRRSVPVQPSGGALEFIHKSVQEFSVAKCILDEVLASVDKTEIKAHDEPKEQNQAEAADETKNAQEDKQLHTLVKIARKLGRSFDLRASREEEERIDNRLLQLLMAAGLAEDKARVAIGGCKSQQLEAVNQQLVRNDPAEWDPAAAGGDPAMDVTRASQLQADILANDAAVSLATNSSDKQADRKRVSNRLAIFIVELEGGALNKIDLASEEAIVDFLVDVLLSDSNKAVALMVAAQFYDRDRLQQLAENVRTLCTMKLPKRKSGTILHAAAECGNMEVAQGVIHFLQHMEDHSASEKRATMVDVTDVEGATPLHVAAAKNHIHMVCLLLQHNADVSHTMITGVGVMHLAAKAGAHKIAAMLITHSTSLLVDKIAKTCTRPPVDANGLQWYQEQGEQGYRLVRLVENPQFRKACARLEESEGREKAAGKFGCVIEAHPDRTLTIRFRERGENETVTGTVVMPERRIPVEALEGHATHGTFELLDAPSCPHVNGFTLKSSADEVMVGTTPMMVAAQENKSEVLRTFINAGADKDALDNEENAKERKSALQHAYDKKCRQAYQVLEKEGADGWTPLHVAAKYGKLDAPGELNSSEDLVELGAQALKLKTRSFPAFDDQQLMEDHESIYIHGRTALQLAAENGQHETAAKLIEAINDIEQITVEETMEAMDGSLCALHMACKSMGGAGANKQGKSKKAKDCKARDKRYLQTISVLLKRREISDGKFHDADCNARPGGRKSPLMLATKRSAITLLLKQGNMNVDASDTDGDFKLGTALYHHCGMLNEEAVETLLYHGSRKGGKFTNPETDAKGFTTVLWSNNAYGVRAGDFVEVCAKTNICKIRVGVDDSGGLETCGGDDPLRKALADRRKADRRIKRVSVTVDASAADIVKLKVEQNDLEDGTKGRVFELKKRFSQFEILSVSRSKTDKEKGAVPFPAKSVVDFSTGSGLSSEQLKGRRQQLHDFMQQPWAELSNDFHQRFNSFSGNIQILSVGEKNEKGLYRFELTRGIEFGPAQEKKKGLYEIEWICGDHDREKKGADPKEGSTLWNALREARFNGCQLRTPLKNALRITELLLNNGADPDDGNPLCRAIECFNGSYYYVENRKPLEQGAREIVGQIIKLLLHSKADVTKTETTQEETTFRGDLWVKECPSRVVTALGLACVGQYSELPYIKMLLGAIPSGEDDPGGVLRNAADLIRDDENCWPEEDYAPMFALHSRFADGYTQLLCDVRHGKITGADLKEKLKREAKRDSGRALKERTDQGETLLHLACEARSLDCVREILPYCFGKNVKEGALQVIDIEESNKAGKTALMIADSEDMIGRHPLSRLFSCLSPLFLTYPRCPHPF